MDGVPSRGGQPPAASGGASPGAADGGPPAGPGAETGAETGATEAAKLPAVERLRRRRRRWWRVLLRRVAVTVALTVLVTVVGLSQTREGQEVVLQAALDRLRGELAGELLVGGIRSGTLVTGATLTDVRLETSDGRPFLRADSVVLRYSLASFVAGGSIIRATTLWGLDVEISRYAPGQPLTVTRLLRESGPGTSAPGGVRSLVLGRIGVRDGVVRLLSPVRPGSRAPTTVGPDGITLQQLSFEDVDLDLESAVLRRGGAVPFEADLASLSSSVYLFDRPLVLREVFGRVSFDERGIRVEDGAFRLPSSLLRGELTLGPERPDEPWTLRARLDVDGWGDLDDLRWIDPRIPPGRFRGSTAVSVPDAVELDLDRFEVELEASHVLASGWVRFDEALTMRSLRMTASPLALERLEPWLGVEFPLEGWLSGQATFSGTLADLNATGRLTLVPTGYGGAATTADFNGTVHRGANPGATAFGLRLDPADYTVLQSWWPSAPLSGAGDASFELDGRAEGGVTIVARLVQDPDSVPGSELFLRGLARRADDGVWMTDLRGELSPLSVGALSRLAPALGLRGTVEGSLALSGRLDDLSVAGELEAPGGRLTVDGRIDLREPGAFYRVEADADSVSLSGLSARLPERSTWTGRLVLEGRGLGLEALESRATFVARDSRVGAVPVDTALAAFRVERGVLVTDTLDARVAGVQVDGRGRFGLARGAWGSSRLSFAAETIEGLRPLVMGVGDSILVSDGLGELDREFLRASGVDPDTLPTVLDVRMAGAVRGAASISGEMRSFDLGIVAEVADGAFRHNQVDSARVELTATELPGTRGSWGMDAGAWGVVVQGRTFEQGALEAEMRERAGRGTVEIVRTADERYRASGSFRFGSTDGDLELETAQVQVGVNVWDLSHPTRVAWNEESISVDSLLVRRAGDDPMSLAARGTLARGGQSDFRVDLAGLHVERVLHVGQFTGLEMAGHIDLDLAVAGPAESPRIDGVFRVDGPRYGTMELTRIDGSLQYADRRASFALQGWDGGRDAIDVTGVLPLDLSLAAVDERVLEEPMDVRIATDSLDAAIALSYLDNLDQVVGTVSGEVHIRGTPDEPIPEGSVTLSDAEWAIEAIGVRHTRVSGGLQLRPDRTVDVELTSAGPGYSSVSGTVLLVPFLDPALDLRFAFDRFQAVDRIDVEALVSGEFQLGGTYRRPVAQGSLTVDEANIYVDEFQRVAGVVDLSDPLLFERGLGVDTTALLAQPLVADLRNPFFDNLRLNIDLAVPRDTWLRSIETNVEMAGDLVVAYDRSAADLVMVGELEAVRGSHLVLGRTFDLDGGTVSFIGRPGLNPDLDIQASTRIRRRDVEDLEVRAQVGGTLIQPVVTLSTEEVGVGEADLVSYLIFGQRTSELGSSQSAIFGQLSQNQAISTLRTGGLTWYGGALANQFGAALAQGTGIVDYLSVQGGLNQLGRTEFEAGRYLGRDVFVVLVFQTTADDTESANPLGGARVEWAPTEDYHVEAFLEDRFLRSGAAGFALPGLLDNDRVVGIFVFRDWGY